MNYLRVACLSADQHEILAIPFSKELNIALKIMKPFHHEPSEIPPQIFTALGGASSVCTAAADVAVRLCLTCSTASTDDVNTPR